MHNVYYVKQPSLMAYCLAIQSLWERQLREFLHMAARELAPGTEARARSPRWEEVLNLFASLRGIGLQDFAQGEALMDLHLLGNVCRHGDGRSLQKLIERKPGLWPEPKTRIDPLDRTVEVERTADNMVIPAEQLAEMGEAVAGIWDVMDYIYVESLERKHESVIRRLPALRTQFAGLIRQNAEAVGS